MKINENTLRLNTEKIKHIKARVRTFKEQQNLVCNILQFHAADFLQDYSC